MNFIFLFIGSFIGSFIETFIVNKQYIIRLYDINNILDYGNFLKPNTQEQNFTKIMETPQQIEDDQGEYSRFTKILEKKQKIKDGQGEDYRFPKHENNTMYYGIMYQLRKYKYYKDILTSDSVFDNHKLSIIKRDQNHLTGVNLLQGGLMKDWDIIIL